MALCLPGSEHTVSAAHTHPLPAVPVRAGRSWVAAFSAAAFRTVGSSTNREQLPGGWPLCATTGALRRVRVRCRPSAGPRPAAPDTSSGASLPCAGRMHLMSTDLYLLAAAHAASAAASAV